MAAAAGLGARAKSYLAGVGALAVLGGIGLPAAAFLARRRRGVPSNVVLHLDMRVPIVERQRDGEAAALLMSAISGERQPLALRAIVRALETAATDKRVKGVVCSFGDTSPSLAVSQELGNAVLAFRNAQKEEPAGARRFAWVTTDTFGEAGHAVGMQQFHLAAHFDQVFMQPSGMIGLTGVHNQTFFLKRLLAKVGIEPQFFQYFEYKNAPNQFTETGFTDAHRFQSELLANSMFDQLVSSIAQLRGTTVEHIRECVSKAPLNAREALSEGLIDSVLYPDQVLSMANVSSLAAPRDTLGSGRDARSAHAECTVMSLQKYINLTQKQQDAALAKTKSKIALLHMTGNIVRGRGQPNSRTEECAAQSVARAISATCKDPSVKGLVVRLDSRGGSAVASDSIRRELERAKDMGLPIVVSMGSFAASGGYYIATAADKIVAQPGTITGSIGAFIGVVSLQQLFERVGISVGEVAVGQDPISVARPLSATQKEKLDKAGRQVYDDFVALVAKARKLSAAEVDAVARGRVWTGAHAKTLGLVDELGGIEEAHDLKAQ